LRNESQPSDLHCESGRNDRPADATPEIWIGKRRIAEDTPVYVIAEIGSNHDGELERALALIDLAAQVGADAVKFQSFQADLLSRQADAVHAALLQLALPESWIPALEDRARERGLHFLSTPFDEGSAERLAENAMPAFKIASGDLTHTPLLEHVSALAAKTRAPVLLSTGLATQDEVAKALRAIDARAPVALLHCVASYPPQPSEWNLRSVPQLAADFGCVVGLSDHSPGHSAACAATALGARVIEKHLSDDPTRSGPDHPYALSPTAFHTLVEALRDIEVGLGSGAKAPAPSEEAGREVGRRSLHTTRDILEGEVLRADMLKVVRPATGLAPDALRSAIGRRACRDLAADAPVFAQDLA